MDERKITVEAPSALLGFFLALRLQDQEARVVDCGEGRWAVELPPEAPREWVLACVQRWLDDEALSEISVQIDGSMYTMTQKARRSA